MTSPCFSPSSRKARMGMSGVSLLEAVCALTIMGSVSAVAVPQIVDLPGEARRSVVQSLRGATESASSLLHVKCATQPACNLNEGASALSVSGTTVVMSRGYPQGGDPAGIQNTLQLSGFNVVHTGDKTVFQKDGAPKVEACAVSYASPRADGGMPVISAETSGC